MCDREIALINLFKKCSEKYNDENIKNIAFNYQDRGDNNNNGKTYVMCYNKNNPEFKKLCGPCFSFFNWTEACINSFEDTKNEIIKMSNNEPLINKVGWIGNINSADDTVPEYYTRPLLKKIADENNDLFDIFHNHLFYNPNTQYLSIIDLVKKYKYLIDIGGNGYSGRLKYLLFSKRPLLIVDRNYIEYFHNDLIPYKHYIPVKMDLSDLLEQVEWMQNNYEKSLEIANNAFEFAINNFTTDKLLERIYYVYNNIKQYKTIYNKIL